MKVNRGAGVWNDRGRLIFYSKECADLVWSVGSSDLYSLELRFGPCREGNGIRHTLKRLEPGTFRPTREAELCVPMGGVERLVINHRGDQSLATWLDQSQWGYVVVELGTMAQLSGGLYYPAASLAPPDFSPNDALIVSCSPFRRGWWTDVIDDYWESSSPGGYRKVGSISIHDLASNFLSHHDVFLDLPPGWIPDRPQDPHWDVIWGPEFVSDREFRIWLPDDSIEVLQLPLPNQVRIERPLSTTRNWLD
jgi:hypothetical protein